MTGRATTNEALLRGRRPELAIALLVAAVAAAALVAITPIVWAIETSAEVAGRRERLATIEHAVRSGISLPEISTAGGFLAGTSAGRASAELQARVADAAKAHGVSVHSIQVLDPKRDGDVMQISVEVNCQANATQFRDFLHLIETGTPLLIAEDLVVRTIPPPAGVTRQSTMLDIDIKVRGFAAQRATP